jgi:hypothetical protein
MSIELFAETPGNHQQRSPQLHINFQLQKPKKHWISVIPN